MTNETLARTATAGPTGATAATDSTGQLAIALSGMFAQWLRGLTINAHERLALAHLWEHGSMTMSELGARIPLSRAAVTALTDRLEALGYVLRTPDEHDRRRTVLSLTTRSGVLIEPMAKEYFADVERLEADLSEGELAAIGRWNASMRAIAHKHADRLRLRSDAELPSGQ